jgi:hypothetical protein
MVNVTIRERDLTFEHSTVRLNCGRPQPRSRSIPSAARTFGINQSSIALSARSVRDKSPRDGKRTFAWLNQFRCVRVRYEKRPNMHLAFLTLVTR